MPPSLLHLKVGFPVVVKQARKDLCCLDASMQCSCHSAHMVNWPQETTGKSLKLTEELGTSSVCWPVLTITVVGDNQLLTTACQKG